MSGMRDLPVATVSAALGSAWTVARENWRPILVITLIVQTPINLLLMLVPLPDDATWQQWARYIRWQSFLALWMGTIGSLAVTHITVARWSGMRLSVADALRRAAGNYGSTVWSQILYYLTLTLGTLLLVVPAVVMAVRWFFAMPAIVAHRLSGWRALEHSDMMVRGRWWRFLGRIVGLGLIMILGVFVAAAPSAFAPDGFVSDVLLMVPVDLVVSFFIVVFTMLYLMSVPGPVPEALPEASPGLRPRWRRPPPRRSNIPAAVATGGMMASTPKANAGGWRACSRGHKYRGPGPCPVCWKNRHGTAKKTGRTLRRG